MIPWTSDQKKKFVEHLNQVFRVYDKKVDFETLDLWFLLQKKITFQQSMQALEDYMLSDKSRFPPKPIDLVELSIGSASQEKQLKDALRLMYPDENAAWALALRAQDESETVIWTEEMRFAWDQVSAMRNDVIAQRKSFQSFYKSRVEFSIQSGLEPKWIVSSGWDKEKRLHRIEEAVEHGYLDRKSLSTEDRRLLADPRIYPQPALQLISGLTGNPSSDGDEQVKNISSTDATHENAPVLSVVSDRKNHKENWTSRPNTENWNIIREMVEHARQEKLEAEAEARLLSRLNIQEKRKQVLEVLSAQSPNFSSQTPNG